MQRLDVLFVSVLLALIACGPEEPPESFEDPTGPLQVREGVVRIEDEGAVQRTAAELEREAEIRARSRDERMSAERVVERLRSKITPKTAVVIGKLARVIGARDEGRYHAVSFEVEEQIAGPPLSGTVEVVQRAVDGEPSLEHGFAPRPGRSYLLVISPSEALPGAWRLLIDYDDQVFGWAAEVGVGVFQFPAGAQPVSRVQLDTLGAR
ncbi:MAG TPA: hypothetical protein ENO23_10835 [Alphaproteobacteria bacterium]|nr:hypothetical protein [Alphaproteobacteria bacterium]